MKTPNKLKMKILDWIDENLLWHKKVSISQELHKLQEALDTAKGLKEEIRRLSEDNASLNNRVCKLDFLAENPKPKNGDYLHGNVIVGSEIGYTHFGRTGTYAWKAKTIDEKTQKVQYMYIYTQPDDFLGKINDMEEKDTYPKLIRYKCATCGNTCLQEHRPNNTVCGGCNKPNWKILKIQTPYSPSQQQYLHPLGEIE